MKTNQNGNTPIFLQIKNHILAKISNQEWSAGMKIPSEAQLGDQFSTSRMTVNRALREMAADGHLIRRQGKGSFVATPKRTSALLEVRSIAEEIRARGGTYACTVHLLSAEKAQPSLAESLNISPYDTVFHSILIHMDKDVPIQLADRYVNPKIAPEYLQQDFSRITPNEYLLSLAPISEVEHVVEALIPDAWVRELLMINAAEPCLALQRKTWVKEIVATRSTFYYPGSRYSLGGRFTPANSGTIQIF